MTLKNIKAILKHFHEHLYWNLLSKLNLQQRKKKKSKQIFKSENFSFFHIIMQILLCFSCWCTNIKHKKKHTERKIIKNLLCIYLVAKQIAICIFLWLNIVYLCIFIFLLFYIIYIGFI